MCPERRCRANQDASDLKREGCDCFAHLQVQLYEDFARSRAKASVDESISTASAEEEEEEKPKLKATGHVFQARLPSGRLNRHVSLTPKWHFHPFFFSPQALQYLRKLCNHPSLVLSPQHPEFKRITEELAAQSSGLRDIQHAPKLSALKQVTSRSERLVAAAEVDDASPLRVSVLSCCWTAASGAGEAPRAARRPWWRSTASSSSAS